VAPVASRPFTDTFRSRPGRRSRWSRPRFPRRTNNGTATPVITMFEIMTPSTVPPSTVSSARPPPSAATRAAASAGTGPSNTQLETTIRRKSPVLSLPSLKQFDALRIRQFVTSTSSVLRTCPSAKLAFRQRASSRDSMSQFAMRTRRQQSGSMPSAYASRTLTPSSTTSSQRAAPPRARREEHGAAGGSVDRALDRRRVVALAVAASPELAHVERHTTGRRRRARLSVLRRKTGRRHADDAAAEESHSPDEAAPRQRTPHIRVIRVGWLPDHRLERDLGAYHRHTPRVHKRRHRCNACSQPVANATCGHLQRRPRAVAPPLLTVARHPRSRYRHGGSAGRRLPVGSTSCAWHRSGGRSPSLCCARRVR